MVLLHVKTFVKYRSFFYEKAIIYPCSVL